MRLLGKGAMNMDGSDFIAFMPHPAVSRGGGVCSWNVWQQSGELGHQSTSPSWFLRVK